jgi:hypothetical protein
MEDAEDTCFVYRGHILMCDPTPAEGGGFRANAVIIRDRDKRTLIADSPERVVLISRDAAIEYAKSWAVNWVDANT